MAADIKRFLERPLEPVRTPTLRRPARRADRRRWDGLADVAILVRVGAGSIVERSLTWLLALGCWLLGADASSPNSPDIGNRFV
jgi:hypothetical protein